MVGMDNTIVNVALPSIGHDFHAGVSGLQWTVDAYVLVLASLLMVAGSTADRYGRRRILQVGLVLFTSGSLICSVAPDLTWLVVSRMVQAIGGSMLNPVAASIIRNTFDDPRERAQAIGVWAAVAGISIALGPIVGGVLVQSVGWRSIFWVNIPVGLAAVALAAYYVPESKAPHPRRADPVGQILVIVLLASVTYSVIGGPAEGWGSEQTIGLFAVAGLAAAGFVGYERKRREPLLELRFFRSVPFSGATVTAVASYAAFGGFLFVNTLYLQEVRGLSALDAGIYTLPVAGMATLMSPISGWIVGRWGPRVSMVVAGAGLTLGSVMLTHITATTSVDWLVAAYSFFGFGVGFVNPPITNTAVSGMPSSQAGVAAAVASTSRQIGQTLGVAVIGAAAASGLHGSLGPSLADGSYVGWWIMAGCGATVLAVGILSTSHWAEDTARRTAVVLTDTEA